MTGPQTSIMRSLYTRTPDQVHHGFIAAVFHTEPPLSAAEQREGFPVRLQRRAG